MLHVVVEDVFVAELMVESNVTLDSQTILSVLNSSANLVVTPNSGGPFTVTLTDSELVAGTAPTHCLLSLVSFQGL